jgi:hypothetical protein
MNELLQDALNLDKNKSTGTDYIGPKILKVSTPFAVSDLTKANQTIKKDKKYKFTPLEKRFIKIYLLLAVFYSIVSVYLLNTPIDEWVFNLICLIVYFK